MLTRPPSRGLWYVMGRGAGEVGVRSINVAVGAVLGCWEGVVRVRRFLRH